MDYCLSDKPHQPLRLTWTQKWIKVGQKFLFFTQGRLRSPLFPDLDRWDEKSGQDSAVYMAEQIFANTNGQWQRNLLWNFRKILGCSSFSCCQGRNFNRKKKEWKENLIMVTCRSWTLKYSSQLMPSSGCSTNELKGMYVQERHEHASI